MFSAESYSVQATLHWQPETSALQKLHVQNNCHPATQHTPLMSSNMPCPLVELPCWQRLRLTSLL
jgi:hypothetical protein